MAPITAKAGDDTCMVFNTVKGVPQGSVVRFVVGEDAQPHEMTQAEIEDELGDPFAKLLLNQGIFPSTGQELRPGSSQSRTVGRARGAASS